jgi:hypothetical protein
VRAYYAADGMHRKLLHGAIDRRGEQLEMGSLRRLCYIFAEARRFTLRLH